MNNSKIWWREYRKRQNKPNPRNLSIEHVLRKTFKQVLKEYINSSSVAGVTKMCDPDISIIQRIIRVSLFCVMFGGIFYFLLYLWYGNLANPLIVVMDTSTYPISNIDFPSVTICNFNRISKKALEKYLWIYKQQNKSHHNLNVLLKEMKQLGRLIDFSYKKTVVNYKFLLPFLKSLGININQVMKELSPPCDEMLIKCAWAGKIDNCSTYFSVHRSVRGHCCVFNHVLNYNSIKRSVGEKYQVKRQHNPGFRQGLNVILDAMIDDYTYTLYNMYGFEVGDVFKLTTFRLFVKSLYEYKVADIYVMIFDSSNFGDPSSGRVVQRIAQPGYASFFEIKSVKQVATREVRKYPASTRKCFFHDELKDTFGDLYSYSYCIMSCRIKAIQSLCKCTPFYFPISTNNVPICDMNDLGCLNKHKEKMMYLYPSNTLNNEGLRNQLQDALRCSECLPDCELTRHFTKHSKIVFSRVENENKEFVDYFFKGVNMTNKALLSIYLGKKTGVLNRLDIVSYWYEIISNIGGFCSILVGFSIISILEVFYFFILRFSYHLYLLYENNE